MCGRAYERTYVRSEGSRSHYGGWAGGGSGEENRGKIDITRFVRRYVALLATKIGTLERLIAAKTRTPHFEEAGGSKRATFRRSRVSEPAKERDRLEVTTF